MTSSSYLRAPRGRFAAFLGAILVASVFATWGVSAVQPQGKDGVQLTSVKSAGPSPRIVNVSLKWEHLLGANTQIVESSPNEAKLDNDGESIVVGSRGNGCVYAVHLNGGSTVSGWPRCTDAGIDSTPSVWAPTKGGLDNVYVTTGDTPGEDPPVYNENCSGNEAACTGSIYAYGPGGNTLWSKNLTDVYGTFGVHPPIFASPTIGDVGTQTEIVVGGISQSLYALSPTTGDTEPGWPQPTADTTFATAAIANIDGRQQIIAASDSSAGAGALNNWNGGSVRSMNSNGSTNWTAASNEVVTSSPVVGNLNGSGPVVAYGHGRYWNGSDDDALTVDNAKTGALEWKASLGGYTRATPAIADITGNGQNDVIEPTWTALNSTTGGTVWAFNPTGGRIWGPVSLGSNNTVTGGVATANLGAGYQDVIAATGLGWYVIDGKSGAVYPPNGLNVTWPGQSAANLSMSNSPLVVPDPSGNGVDVVVAGTYYGGNGDNTQGFIAEYQITGGPNSTGTGSWPMFHDNPQLTGTTLANAGPPNLQVACHPNVPPCSIEGYWMDASDGGIFAFGNTTFHGSMGGRPLNKPVVGMAPTPSGKGYWEVASDGGIFSFGDAGFHGSMGGKPLDQPVVGMAATPNGQGYWEVASDGGIFAFGNAKFYGSMGGKHLNKPIVGMASTSNGEGYWLVASDGGLFAFGNAKFHGSMGNKHLNDPVVGMAAEPDGQGYWEVASDGGIFAFNAPFYGSTGNIRLNKPVTGMAATSDGKGYWFAATDGGVFSFGNAFFRGSTGSITLNAPVVGIAGTG